MFSADMVAMFADENIETPDLVITIFFKSMPVH